MDTHIRLRGLRQNNLKNIDIDIPLGKFCVVCGPSGSGKSSLAFDCLYAEGQRRYIDSLSNYSKQFLNKAPKPDLDSVSNIPPALALEQKNQVRNSRSTVGSSTEFNDYLRLFFAKLGRAFCPHGHGKIESQDASKVAHKLNQEQNGERGYLLFCIEQKNRSLHKSDLLASLQRDGYQRVIYQLSGQRPEVHEITTDTQLPQQDFWVVVDRLQIKEDELGRLTDSVRNAYTASVKYNFLAAGRLYWVNVGGEGQRFSEDLSCSQCDYSLPPVSEALFNYSSPVGACPSCKGFGNILQLDLQKIIPKPQASLAKGAIFPFTMPSAAAAKSKLFAFCREQGIDLKTPWQDLSEAEQQMILYGKARFKGVFGLFEQLEEKRYKMHVRIFLARFKSPVRCQDCGGSRLQENAQHVFIGGKNFRDLQNMNFGELQDFFSRLQLSKMDQEIAAEILKQLRSRLQYLNEVGLHYLCPIRETRTLSGGEYQRIKLANQLGMELSETLYVLDEPSIGLHPRDNDRLIGILKKLKKLGNTLVVVEHDRDLLQASEHVLEIGPRSGRFGGELVFSGSYDEFLAKPDSLTARYLRQEIATPAPTQYSEADTYLQLKSCVGHNLKAVDLKIPLRRFCVVTGVSGSGKSSLIQQTLYPALARALDKEYELSLPYGTIENYESLQDVILIDQKAVGRSGRSNPASYLGIYDEIRKLFAASPLAEERGLGAGYFSLNVDGGRCPTCKGDGFIEIDMQFMDDVRLLCEDCGGRRFKKDCLEIRFAGKNIAEVLEMSVDEAFEFFVAYGKIRRLLNYLQEVGLGYIALGQPANTLSGGESQRLKIAKELSKAKLDSCLYILDEPTTGLHFQEIDLLVLVLRKLVERGGSLVVIEHNLDLIRCADYIVDVGPDGGDAGGYILYQGPLSGLKSEPLSLTANYL